PQDRNPFRVVLNSCEETNRELSRSRQLDYSFAVNWDKFQLWAVAIGVIMLAIRIVILRMRTGVNPVKINHPSEVGFVLGEVLIAVLLLRVTKILAFSLPAWMDVRIVDSGRARILGAIFLVIGLLLFGLALISFGDSWRIGIDRKTPSTLVTGK